jgi:hypothetical protein
MSFSINNILVETASNTTVFEIQSGQISGIDGGTGATGPTGTNFVFQNNPPINETILENTYLDNKYNLYGNSDSGFPQLLNLPSYYTGNIINVSDETEFNNALASASDYDIILIEQNLVLTGLKTINKKLKIIGSSPDISITFSSSTNIFTITSSEVWITELTFNNPNLASNANILGFTNANAILNFVTNCIFNTNEFAIITANSLIQITNNEFRFIGSPPDSHRYIFLTGCTGTCYINNNLFVGSSDVLPYVTRCVALTGVALSYLNGKIVISGNTSENSCQQFFISDISLVGSNVSFYFSNNIIKCFTGYIIFFTSLVLSGIKEIFIYNNTEILTDDSPGSKGIIALDGPVGTINFNTNIYSAKNTVPELRATFTDLANPLAEQPRVIAYATTQFNPTQTYNIILPLLTNIIGPQVPVYLGSGAGEINQNIEAIAIGINAGKINQFSRSISIGFEAGNQFQGTNSVAIGSQAGQISQGVFSVAMGTNAGENNQSGGGIAIGYNSGKNSQGTSAVAIGFSAGSLNQGTQSIAIGYEAGQSNQHNNSVIINAGTSVLNSNGSSRLFINPIRNDNARTQALCYDTTTSEITYSTSGTKTFVINHPNDENKYLVHACLEGSEAGVYYRGNGEIINNNECQIELPNYTNNLANNWTVNLTLRGNNWNSDAKPLRVSDVIDCKFKVYGENGSKFYWTVYGERENIQVEVDKLEYRLFGDGPYKYLQKI